jgi:hypothetical protein
VGRIWTIATVAEAFHVLPSVVARDLDEDPEQLAIVCVQLLRYADAHRAYREAGRTPGRGGKELMRSWKKTPSGRRLMEMVEANDFPEPDEAPAAEDEVEA